MDLYIVSLWHNEELNFQGHHPFKTIKISPFLTYLLNLMVDFDQICIDKCLEKWKESIRFW